MPFYYPNDDTPPLWNDGARIIPYQELASGARYFLYKLNDNLSKFYRKLGQLRAILKREGIQEPEYSRIFKKIIIEAEGEKVLNIYNEHGDDDNYPTLKIREFAKEFGVNGNGWNWLPKTKSLLHVPKMIEKYYEQQ